MKKIIILLIAITTLFACSNSVDNGVPTTGTSDNANFIKGKVLDENGAGVAAEVNLFDDTTLLLTSFCDTITGEYEFYITTDGVYNVTVSYHGKITSYSVDYNSTIGYVAEVLLYSTEGFNTATINDTIPITTTDTYITGKVVDDEGYGLKIPIFVIYDSILTYQTYSDFNGYYKIKGVKNGKYGLAFWGPEFSDTLIEFEYDTTKGFTVDTIAYVYGRGFKPYVSNSSLSYLGTSLHTKIGTIKGMVSSNDDPNYLNGFSGTEVYLKNNKGLVLDSTTTNENGVFLFNVATSGDYSIHSNVDDSNNTAYITNYQPTKSFAFTYLNFEKGYPTSNHVFINGGTFIDSRHILKLEYKNNWEINYDQGDDSWMGVSVNDSSFIYFSTYDSLESENQIQDYFSSGETINIDGKEYLYYYDKNIRYIKIGIKGVKNLVVLGDTFQNNENKELFLGVVSSIINGITLLE